MCDLYGLLPVTASDFHVCLVVEGIAAQGENIDISPVHVHEVVVDQRAVRHDGNRLEMQFLLAEDDEISGVFFVEERFAAGKVDLAHAGFFKKA